MDLISAVALMAVVTYSMRALPMLLFRKPVENERLQAFFTYIPYAVLASMVVPGMFLATSSIFSAVVGFAVAVILAWRTENLPLVVFGAGLAVWAWEFFLI